MRITGTLWIVSFILCVSCQLLQPNKRRPYVEIVYTVNGEQKQFQEDKHGGFGLGQKYWVGFRDIDDGERVLFASTGCSQEMILKSDEEYFIDGKKYYDDKNWGTTYFSGTPECFFEYGWFSFHIVDDGDVCYEVTFDTVWSDIETGETINVVGTLYVYDKYYGRYWAREYRHYIVPQQ